MGWYQDFMADTDMPVKIYHLCPAKDWEQRPRSSFYKPTNFEKDGNITRCMHDPHKLMETANCFYQKSSPAKEQWLCLEIDTVCLRLNGMEVEMVPSEMDDTLKCPHVKKDPIPSEAVTKVFKVVRDDTTGQFIVVTGLTDTCSISGKQVSA